MKISICVPVYNGEEWLKELLESFLNQEVDYRYELVISDAGSTDRSREILREYNSRENFKYIEIPNSEYGHGKTRNFLSEEASGEYVLFTVQDALPIGRNWLSEIVRGMEANPDVVAAFCRHDARNTSHPVKMRYIQKTFDDYLGEIRSYPSFVENEGLSYFNDTADIVNWDLVTAHSNVCAVYRREVLLSHPFKDINFAEDKSFAKEALERGSQIGFFDKTVVYHSHDYSYIDTYKRTVDEWVAIKKTGTYEQQFKVYHVLTQSIKSYLRDTQYSLRCGRLGLLRKVSSIFTNFLMELMIKSGMYVGLNHERFSESFMVRSSYQSNWRKPSIDGEK